MKDLEEANKILGMEIVRDRNRKILRVSQSGYISKILNRFRINNRKSVQMPLGGHFKLSLKDCPIRDCDVERMSKVPYANEVGSLTYLMVCTRPDIAYAYRDVFHSLNHLSVKIKVINGSRVVLSGTRSDNCVYSLDGHAVAGELNASVEEKDSLAQLRTNNGLEFCNREFKQLCIESGIARHLTVAGTPQ
nr:retrovirus-related Pol polyprotein from transposon TNT 1-94 [Tanacetum cinerariifolium]